VHARGSGVIALAIAMCACGRISFDPLGTGSADANRDGTTTADSATVPAGPRIWLQMETQPTVTIVDSAGGHAVSCAGGICPTRDVGVHGFGYTFAMEQLNVADGADLDSSAGFSAAVWVNVHAMPNGVACFWTKSFDNTNGWDTFTLCIQADGTTVFDCESPTGVTDSPGGPIVALNQWHHLAMTWDGTIKRGYLSTVSRSSPSPTRSAPVSFPPRLAARATTTICKARSTTCSTTRARSPRPKSCSSRRHEPAH